MASKLKMIFWAGVVAEVRKWNAPRPEMKHFKFSNRWGHLGREVVREVADKVREEEGTHTDFSVHVYDKLIMFSSENSIFEFHLLNDRVKIKVETPTEAPQTTEDFILLSDIDDEIVTEFGPEPLKVKSERELMVEEKERLEGIKKRSRGEEGDLQNIQQQFETFDRNAARVADDLFNQKHFS